MPKIRISMDKMSVSVDIKENADYLFIKIANELFCNCIGNENVGKVVEKLEGPKLAKPKKMVAPTNIGKTETEDENQIKYKGFIYWKCADCGAERGFNLSKESKGIHCMNCGSDHLFKEPLKPLYAQCECGKAYRYLTNMKEEIFDMPCMVCESSMSVRWNEKKQVYESIS